MKNACRINIGVCGTGGIAHIVIQDIIKCCPEIFLYACASRKSENARTFCNEYGFYKYFDSYDELFQCEALELIYIATPTEVHYEHIKRALESKINVICEKPLCCNHDEGENLYTIAAEKNVVLMDAIWPMYMPAFDAIMKINESKAMGDIKSIFASFGYPGLRNDRLLNPRGGGALLDLGVYCVAYILANLNWTYDSLKSKVELKHNVDIDTKAVILKNGIKARLHCSIKHRTSYLLYIRYAKGILISRKFWLGKNIYLIQFPFFIKRLRFDHEGTGYEHEFKEAIKLIQEKCYINQKISPQNSLKIMKCMDEIRENSISQHSEKKISAHW